LELPSHISGTSAESDNRCLYAAGYSIPEIVNILKKGIFNFSNILIKRQGLFAMKGFHDIYKNFPQILLRTSRYHYT
jgi:NTE family protein